MRRGTLDGYDPSCQKSGMHRMRSSSTFVAPSRAPRLFAALMLLTLVAHGDDALADADIGAATSITTAVTGTIASTNAATLKSGDPVFQNETIITDANGVGQFQFRDQTKLAIGPGSTLVLDNFVYDSDTSKAKVVINLTAGAMRFITGKADHDAYEIVTPTATIGVRGTVFDVYTKPDGELAVAMINGAIDICPRTGACHRHDVIGKFLHMTADGVFTLRDHWDENLFGGIPFKAALPFLYDQKILVPDLRGDASTVAGYLALNGKSIEKILKLPLTRLPKLNLPKLFH